MTTATPPAIALPWLCYLNRAGTLVLLGAFPSQVKAEQYRHWQKEPVRCVVREWRERADEEGVGG